MRWTPHSVRRFSRKSATRSAIDHPSDWTTNIVPRPTGTKRSHPRSVNGFDNGSRGRCGHRCVGRSRARGRPRVREARCARRAAGAGGGGARRGATRSRGARRQGDSSSNRRRGLRRGGRGGRAGRGRARADRHLGERRDGHGLCPVPRHRAGRVQTRDGGHLLRGCPRHDRSVATNGAPRPRHRRPGRLGALLPGDSASIRLLRREVRNARLHRLDSHRAAPRRQQGLDHDGAAAGCEHAAVQLVPRQGWESSTARAADLPTGSCRRSRLLGRTPSSARARRRLQLAEGDRRKQACPKIRRLVPRADRVPVAADPGRADGRSRRQPLRSRSRRSGHTRHLRRTRARPEHAAVGDDTPPTARRCTCDDGGRVTRTCTPRALMPDSPPHVLREYALLADGERGILVGPRGDFSWMCFPRWHDDAVFSTLVGAAGEYAVTPVGRYVWGGYYEAGSLIWRSRWLTEENAIIESREALALPTRADRAVILRRVIAHRGTARLDVVLNPRGRFGNEAPRDLARAEGGTGTGRCGELRFAWLGGAGARPQPDGAGGPVLTLMLELEPGQTHDLVLVLALD